MKRYALCCAATWAMTTSSPGGERSSLPTGSDRPLAVARRRAVSTVAGRTVLAVKCQDVLPGEAETADWRILIKASMMPMPVVAVQPERQRATPLI
jgi:propanediol dehydratase small subunit